MRVSTSQYEISGKNPICSVKPFSLIEHNYLPETKFIGTSSILGWGKSGVLPTDPVFRLEWFFFHLLFIHVVWEVNWLDVFESKPFVFFFRDHLRSSLGITCGLGIICRWVRKLRRVFRLPTSNFQLPTSNFRLQTSDFRFQTSDFRLPTFVAIKSGGRPTRLLPYSKMLLVPITFFFLLPGRLCSGRFYIFYEQMWFKPPVSHWEARWCAHYDRQASWAVFKIWSFVSRWRWVNTSTAE